MSKTKLIILNRQHCSLTLSHPLILWFSWVLRFKSHRHLPHCSLSSCLHLVLSFCCHDPWWTPAHFLFDFQLTPHFNFQFISVWHRTVTGWRSPRMCPSSSSLLAVWHASGSVWLFHSPLHPHLDSSHSPPLSQMFCHFLFNRLCVFSTSVLLLSQVFVPDPSSTGSTNGPPIFLGLGGHLFHGTFLTTHHMPCSKTTLMFLALWTYCFIKL